MTNIHENTQLFDLCELASKEHDSEELIRLVSKINKALDELTNSESKSAGFPDADEFD